MYSIFRRHVESKATIRPPIDAPRVWRPSVPVPDMPVTPEFRLSPLATVGPTDANTGPGRLPSLHALGVPDLAAHFAPLSIGAVPSLGGADTAALTASVRAASSGEASSASPAGTLGDGEASALPSLTDKRSVLPFAGGETAALGRLKHYFWTANALKDYKVTRNGLLGADYSSKFSPWLALGCISPRTIAAEVKAYEARVVANESTYWLLFELIWRDFFRFAPLNWGRALFHRSGPRHVQDPSRVWRKDPRYMAAWAAGRSGYPFVDANMRELLLTGFMSNRGRQNVGECQWLATSATGMDAM